MDLDLSPGFLAEHHPNSAEFWLGKVQIRDLSEFNGAPVGLPAERRRAGSERRGFLVHLVTPAMTQAIMASVRRERGFQPGGGVRY